MVAIAFGALAVMVCTGAAQLAAEAPDQELTAAMLMATP
jgi:hypothetical protein